MMRRIVARGEVDRGAIARAAVHASVLVLAGSSLLSCGSAPSEIGAQPLTRSVGVVGGITSPQSHDAIVLLRADRGSEGWINCSGTLVSPSVVVTAKHCVADIPDKSFVCRPDGDLVPDGSGAGVFGATFDAETLSVHVGASPSDEPAAKGAGVIVSDAYSACRDDLAILILDRPVSVPSYVPIRWNATTRPGENVTLLGYGMGELHHTVVRREVANVPILEVGSIVAEENPTTPPRSLNIGGDTVCSGDSGGPALAKSGALVGTYSRITGDCFSPDSRNTYILAAGFRKMLTEAFIRSGDSPTLEDGSDWSDAAQVWGLAEFDPNAAVGSLVPVPADGNDRDAGVAAASGETFNRGPSSPGGCLAAAGPSTKHGPPSGTYAGVGLMMGGLAALRLRRSRRLGTKRA